MLCEQCGENEATVRVEAFAPDGSSAARMLCQDCARKLRPNLRALDISDFLNALIGKIREDRQEKEQERFDASCEECGLSWAEYRRRGTLGCPGCYRAFREPLEEMLVKKNGSALYMGITPAGARVNDEIYALKKLKEQLKSAIDSEDFERAAVLRDEIKRLNGEMRQWEDSKTCLG